MVFPARFRWTGLILAAALLFTLAGLNYYRNLPPACPANLSGIFTHPLINLDEITAIQPYGWTNGVDHILPVDHVSFVAVPSGEMISPVTTVYSPADITITKISDHVDYDASGNPYMSGRNYMLEFAVCGKIHAWLEGLHELSPAINAAFLNASKNSDESSLNAGSKATNSWAPMNIKVMAGDQLGTTGGISVRDSIAITTYNDDQQPKQGVDYSYYPDAKARMSAFCFADLYPDNIRNALYDKFGLYTTDSGKGVFVPRTVEPQCGELVTNIPGTIQGDWFYGKPRDSQENLQSEGRTLSFIPNNVDPDIGEISIGGMIQGHPQRLPFVQAENDTVDRKFSETTAGPIYCYQELPADFDRVKKIVPAKDLPINKIVVQLLDDHRVRVESQTGECSAAESFKNPYVYER